MARIEEALARLEAALGAAEAAVAATLEAALAAQSGAAAGSAAAPGQVPGGIDVEALLAEREELLARIALLEEQAEEDAKLRAEAAEAVKAALSDLRAVARGEGDRRHG